jgi:hypothetical protein
MLLSLNFLAQRKTSGWQKEPIGPGRPANAAQGLAVQYLHGITDVAIRGGFLGLLDTAERNTEPDYVGDTTDNRVWLDPDALSLPQEGVAGTADVLQLLPEEIRTQYGTRRCW